MIWPHIPAIQQEVDQKKIGKPNYSGNDRLTITPKGQPWHCIRNPKVEVVSISESLTRQVLKSRTLIESVPISDKVSITVTRANQK